MIMGKHTCEIMTEFLIDGGSSTMFTTTWVAATRGPLRNAEPATEPTPSGSRMVWLFHHLVFLINFNKLFIQCSFTWQCTTSSTILLEYNSQSTVVSNKVLLLLFNISITTLCCFTLLTLIKTWHYFIWTRTFSSQSDCEAEIWVPKLIRYGQKH